MRTLKFIRYFMHSRWALFVGIIVTTVLYAVLTLVTPLVVSFVIDNVIDGVAINSVWLKLLATAFGGVANIRQNLWLAGVMILVVTLILALDAWLRNRFTAVLSESFTRQLRDEMYDHLQRLPYSYHVQAQSGDLIQRCTSDVDQIRRFIANQIREFVYAVSILTVAIIILLGINQSMALVVFLIMPVIVILSLVFFKRMQTEFQKADDAEGLMSNTIQENLNGTRVVKAFNREIYELERFEAKNYIFRKLSENVSNQLAMFWGSSELICYAWILMIVLLGIRNSLNGMITLGDFFVFVSYATMVFYPVRNLGRVLSDMGKVTVSIGRLCAVLDVEEEDLTTGLEPEIEGHLVFDHVFFKYDDGDHDVLKDVSFEIPARSTIAIMGPTGSGKSSLMYLLTRLYDYHGGSILLDGVELKTISRHFLRSKVGIVLQEPFLFSKSIFENIRIAAPEASEKDIYRAAAMSEVHGVITEFDKGYQTMVGEKGVTLSGGQKQRIAIARTIINESPILIFDDSLSAVDTETDAHIRDQLATINQATTFIITHRVASAQSADLIVVLEGGSVAQIGTHEQLLHEAGLYQRIAQIQSGTTVEEVK